MGPARRMVDVREATWRFINMAPITGSQPALDELFVATLEPFGVDRFDCGRLVIEDRPRQVHVSEHGLSEWVTYYADQHYIESDPVRLLYGHFRGPFTWTDVKRLTGGAGGRLWADASDGGMREGLIVPTAPRRLTGLSVRLTTPEACFNPDALPLLKSISVVYASSVAVIGAKNVELDAPEEHGHSLTEREIECLHWSVRGKTNAEIGAIISISRHTVNSHIESAKRKLGVATRVQAAAIAHRLGLLSIT